MLEESNFDEDAKRFMHAIQKESFIGLVLVCLSFHSNRPLRLDQVADAAKQAIDILQDDEKITNAILQDFAKKNNLLS